MLEVNNILENHWNRNLESIASRIQDPERTTVRLDDKSISLEEYTLTVQDDILSDYLSRAIEINKKIDSEKNYGKMQKK